MRIFLLAITMLISGNSCFAQNIQDIQVVVNKDLIEEDGLLPYAPNYITWKDFKGKPDQSCGFVAMTYSGIKMTYSYKTQSGLTSLKVQVCPYMDVKKSWYKKEQCGDSTLEHERRHFDITALVTKRFSEELKRQSFSVVNLQSEIKKLHKDYLKRLEEMQTDYDRETEHGINRQKQILWNKKIAEELGG